jgi:flagellar biosynthetic protein FliQ
MSQFQALDVAHNALLMVVFMAGPGLTAILVVGLVVSAFQAMTQINETTLSFIPKMLVLGAVLALLGPWMLQTLVNYTVTTISQIADVVR